jgi:hypothetical protein
MIIRTGTIMGGKLKDAMTICERGKQPAKGRMNATLR